MSARVGFAGAFFRGARFDAGLADVLVGVLAGFAIVISLNRRSLGWRPWLWSVELTLKLAQFRKDQLSAQQNFAL